MEEILRDRREREIELELGRNMSFPNKIEFFRCGGCCRSSTFEIERDKCESFLRTPFSVQPTMSENGSSPHVKGVIDTEKDSLDTLVAQIQLKEGK